MALAVRFAPYLISNTTNVPVDFRRFWDRNGTFPITVDTFDGSGPSPRRVGRDTIDLPRLTTAPCQDLAAVEQFPEIAVALVQENDRVTRHQFNFMLTPGF